MRTLARTLVATATRHPLWVLSLVGMLIAASLPGFWRLELATDARALVPESAPEIVRDHAIRARFDVRDPLVVVVRTDRPDGVYEPAVLAAVDGLTRALEAVPGVRRAHVRSLSTESGFHPLPGTFRFRTLLDPLPRTPEQARELASDLERIRLYDGILVSHDGASASILVGVPAEGAVEGESIDGTEDRWAFYNRVRAAVESFRDEATDGESPGWWTEIVGPPVAEARLGRQVLHDLGLTPWRPSGELGEPSLGVGLVPLALLLMFAVLWLAFGRLPAALLPLAEVGVCLVIVFGLMGWLGIPIYITSTVLPVILTAVGVADEIHVFHRFRQLAGQNPEGDRGELVRAALDDMIPPISKTSITTSIGFLSFALSPLPPVRLFGLFAALGVLVCFLLSLTLVPACLVLLPAKSWLPKRPDRFAAFRVEGRLASLGRFAWRRRTAVLVAMALLAVLAGSAVGRVEVQDSWIDAFDPSSDFARAMHHFDDRFLGTHQLLLSLEYDAPELVGTVDGSRILDRELRLPPPAGSEAAEAADPDLAPTDLAPNQLAPNQLAGAWVRLERPEGGDLPARHWSAWIEQGRIDEETGDWVLELPRRGGSPRFWLIPQEGEQLHYEIRSEPLVVPARLEQIRELEETLRALPGVGGVLGPASYLETTSFMLSPDNEEARRLPERPDQARTLWSHYGRVRGEERLALLVDAERWDRALVTLFLERSNYRETSRVIQAIREHEESHPEGPRLGLAGDVLVSQVLIEGVVDSQLRSLALSLLGIFAAASLLGGSWRWGLACVLPPAWAVLLDFAVMGAVGIPLGVATSMFAGMSLGVGVDYAIHLFERLERERAAAPEDGEQSVIRALGTAGPAILVDALAVGLGFSVLVLSRVPGNARLGLLLVLAVVGCLVATTVLVPALWASLRPRTDGQPH